MDDSTEWRTALRSSGRAGALVRSWFVHGAALLFAALFLLAGCASSGGEDYGVERGELATSPLPSISRASHAPDSLVHLRLFEEDGRLKFDLNGSYRDMLLEWSTRQQNRSGSFFRTYATLWSKELALASLVPKRAAETLTLDLARDLVAERTAEYDSTVQISVYLFARSLRSLDLGDLRLDAAGRRASLYDEAGNRYEPARIESEAPLEAYYVGERALYGRSEVFFDRYTEDGTDLLDARELRLHVRPRGPRFTWRFPENESVAARAE